MIRKIVLSLFLLLLFPVCANAWYVNSKTSPASGQGTISPAGNKSYPAGANSGEYTVTPAPGYGVSRVALDGIRISPNANGRYVVPYLASASWRYLVAYFAVGTVNIGTEITAGSGAIREDSNESLTGIPLGSSRQLLVIPNPGYAVASVTATGAVVTDLADGSRKVVYDNLQSNQTVSASFSLVPVVTVSAGNDATAYGAGAEFAATLFGSATSNQGAISYAWSGAGLSFGTPGAAVTTVYAASPGSYTATLTVSSGTFTLQDSAAVTVLNRTEYLNSSCTGCHSMNTTQLVADYYASLHVGKTSCQDCHTEQPHEVGLPASNPCINCHADASGAVASHPLAISDPCLACHNPHSTAAFAGAPAVHYNNVTSAGYPASYMTSRATCSDCHNGSSGNAGIRDEWAASAHGAVDAPAWTIQDFKTKPGCVQCHTATGFIAYSTGRINLAWGDAADKTKEVLTCIGCHKDVLNGVVRGMAPVRPYADDSYLNRDAGASNVCMACHSGTKNGTSIALQLAAQADFGNLPFISPHYLAAGGVLHGRGGYHFQGGAPYAFYSSNSHRGAGIGDRNGSGNGGPCVACHKRDGGHSFAAGATPLCANCHGASLPVETLAAKRAAFGNGLDVLKAMLDDKGISYDPASRYFGNSNWGSGQAGSDTMGAAFNYALLVSEPGAYAHNSAYARKLISDSVDYLYNGGITGSVQTALDYLVSQQRITRESADSFAAYQAGGSCTSCHNNASGSHTAHLTSGFGCIDCHGLTAGLQNTLAPGNAAHINGSTDVVPGPARTFSYSFAPSGGSCSSVSCHNNGTATWGGTLGCDGCHGAPPATASHLKHYGGTVLQAAYGATGIARDLGTTAEAYLMNCGNCHPMDGVKHGNGTVEVELYNPSAPSGSLKALNPSTASYTAGDTLYQDDRGIAYSKGSCSNIYCHSYKSWTTPTGVPSYSTTCTPQVPGDLVISTNYKTVTWESGSLGCAGCHANPPQTSYPSNGGGAGDSHAWLSDPFAPGSVEFLHKNNMYWETGSSEPIACLYCHNDTVQQKGTYTRTYTPAATYADMSDVPIGNFAKHVNGVNDVAFEKQVAVPTIDYVYGSTWSGQKLSNATYDTATKTCSNVACHLLRTNVQWGTPYKGGVVNDCERCHTDYGGTCPDSAAAMSHLPSITSTAPTLAAPGYTYSYPVSASEPGGGALTYTLATAPAGMTISSSGVISWTPGAEQLGDAPVRVVVASVASSGTLAVDQEFTVTVQPPGVTIVSTPVTAATAWKSYSYKVVATAPSGMPTATYALTAFPSGMTISSTTGTISWTPTDLQIGSYGVTVTATSGGYQATQTFSIQMSPSPVTITSTPVTTASTETLYNYQVVATTEGTGTFSYSLLTKPTGMTINSATGLISWTPSSTTVGSYAVTVQAAAGGYYSRQSFTVVCTASPITITSTPVTTAKVGVPYSYQVTATISNGLPLTYSLTVRPTTAMVIGSSTGLITWTPTSTYVGTRAVTVRAYRGSSSTTQSFSIVVSP